MFSLTSGIGPPLFGDRGDQHEEAPNEWRSWAEPHQGYLHQDAARFFYRWGSELSAALIRVRARFDGDLDQYVLYVTFLLSELSQSLNGRRPKVRRCFSGRRFVCSCRPRRMKPNG